MSAGTRVFLHLLYSSIVSFTQYSFRIGLIIRFSFQFILLDAPHRAITKKYVQYNKLIASMGMKVHERKGIVGIMFLKHIQILIL